MKKLILIFLIALMATNSYAINSCSMTPGATSGFDTILNTYAAIAQNWAVLILPKAQGIFWFFFSMEFIYQIVIKKIIAVDIQKVASFFITRVFTGYLFAHVFLDITFYTGIITYFTTLGSYLGGTAITLAGGTSGMAVSPSSIMNFLECQYAVPSTALATASLSPLGGQLFAMLLFAVLFLVISIPVALMITMLDAYIVIFGGFILCGFAGSSWTQSYWQKYLSYVGGVAIRLFVTCLILGVVIKSFDTLNSMTINNVASGLPSPSGMATYIEAMFGLLFFNVIAMVTIPNKAASMLSGSINGGLGEVIGGASMMMSGMRGVSSASGAAKILGGGVMGAPAAGKTAAIGKARELLGGGASGGSNPTDWKSAAKSAGADASRQSVKDGWSNALGHLRNGTGNSPNSGGGGKNGGVGKLGDAARQAGGMSSGHSGASELNVNAHRD